MYYFYIYLHYFIRILHIIQHIHKHTLTYTQIHTHCLQLTHACITICNHNDDYQATLAVVIVVFMTH